MDDQTEFIDIDPLGLNQPIHIMGRITLGLRNNHLRNGQHPKFQNINIFQETSAKTIKEEADIMTRLRVNHKM